MLSHWAVEAFGQSDISKGAVRVLRAHSTNTVDKNGGAKRAICVMASNNSFGGKNLGIL